MKQLLLMALGGGLAAGLDNLMYGLSHGPRKMGAPRRAGEPRATVPNQQKGRA